jgi:hypothetical protein
MKRQKEIKDGEKTRKVSKNNSGLCKKLIIFCALFVFLVIFAGLGFFYFSKSSLGQGVLGGAVRIDNLELVRSEANRYKQALSLEQAEQFGEVSTTTKLEELKKLVTPILETRKARISSLKSLKDENLITDLEFKSLNEIQNSPVLDSYELNTNRFLNELEDYVKNPKTPEGLYLKNYTDTAFLEVSDKILGASEPKYDLGLDKPATDRIYALALKRGYKFRSIQATAASPELEKALLKMIEASKKELAPRPELVQTSVYRSPSDQKEVFLQRLNVECVKRTKKICDSAILNSMQGDDIVEAILATTSVPGTSKHHTGITVDIDELGHNNLDTFYQTNSYRWMSDNNFYNAKRFGFIPSYPAGGRNMGPNPEPWEFVYIGKEVYRQ